MSPADLDRTRQSLHGVAEMVLAAPQYDTSGSIRLRVTPGGFGTTADPDLRVDGIDPPSNNPTTRVLMSTDDEPNVDSPRTRPRSDAFSTPLTRARRALSKTTDELVEPEALIRTPLPLASTGAQPLKEVFSYWDPRG